MCELNAHLQIILSTAYTIFMSQLKLTITSQKLMCLLKALPFKIQDSGCIGNALYYKNIFVTVTTLRTINGRAFMC